MGGWREASAPLAHHVCGRVKLETMGSCGCCRMPWEDPATAFGALGGLQAPLPPPEIAARQARAAAKQAAEMKVRASWRHHVPRGEKLSG